MASPKKWLNITTTEWVNWLKVSEVKRTYA